MSKPESSVNVEMLASAVDDIREVCRAAVAGLISDGFTETQARAIFTSLVTGVREGGDSNG